MARFIREITISHVDTCLPCYVQDHCNGPTELLVGVYVDGNTLVQTVVESLSQELNGADKIPAGITEAQINAAILEELPAGTMGDAFDSSLEAADDDDGEGPQAWFHVTWNLSRAEQRKQRAEEREQARMSAIYRRRDRVRENARAAAFAEWTAAGASTLEANLAGYRAADAASLAFNV